MRCIVVSFGGSGAGSGASSSVEGPPAGVRGGAGGVCSVSKEENCGDTPSGGTDSKRLTSASVEGSSGSCGGGTVAFEPLDIVTTRAPPAVSSLVLAAGATGDVKSAGSAGTVGSGVDGLGGGEV